MSAKLIAPFVFALGMNVAAAQSTSTPAATGIIAGTVLDITSGQAISDVTISMNVTFSSKPRDDAGSLRPVRTDAQGRFVFTGLQGGRYSFRVRHDGYAHVRGASVTLNDGQMVSGLTLRAGRHGSITGTVRDDNGDPIVGVRVRSFSRRILGFRPSLVPGTGAVSDDRGQFRIADLPPGDYLVCACERDALPIDMSLLTRVAPNGIPASSVARRLDGAVLTFPPTFHPGHTRAADAVSIPVGYSEDRSGIDITMHPVAARKVSGRLVGGGLNASTTHTLTLIAAGDDPTSIGIAELPAVRMTSEGAFDFAAVPPGNYTLEAYPSNGKKGLSASVAVTVDDRDVTDVTVPLGPGATIRGRVEFSGGTARPDGDKLEKTIISLVPIVLTPAVLIRIGATGAVMHFDTLSRDGSFTVEDLPAGQYMVRVSVPASVWQSIESVSTVDRRILQPVLDVPPIGLDAVVVTMSDATMALLEATVNLGEYELPAETRVGIFPVNRDFWAETYRASSRFVFNTAGSFGVVAFPNIPAGEYYVVELSPEDGQMSPERLAEWAKRATVVTLRDGQKTSVVLRRPGL